MTQTIFPKAPGQVSALDGITTTNGSSLDLDDLKHPTRVIPDKFARFFHTYGMSWVQTSAFDKSLFSMVR